MSDGTLPSPGGAPPCPKPRHQHPLAHYQFSAEELRVLRECNTESFFQRSLPIGTGLGLAAYYGVKRGFLSPNQRFGAVPKVVVSVIVGYFIGKVSYQRKCAQKLMQLPNSKLAEVLRQRKKGSLYDSLTPDQGLGAGLALAPFTTPNPDIYSDETIRKGRVNSLDLDTERPVQKGLDDTYRPTLDSPAIVYEDNLPAEPPKQTVSYDELRKQNRDEYYKKSQNQFYRPVPPEAPTVIRGKEEPTAPEPEKPQGTKNRYGDVWTQ